MSSPSPSNCSASVDAILAADTGDSSLIHNLATRAREMEALASMLMRTCYDEANRLANHGSSGLEKLVMSQLYNTANAAKKKLNGMDEGRRTLDLANTTTNL